MKEDQERLKQAEESKARLVERVREDNEEVQKAMKALEAAQAELSEDPLMGVVNLKNGGIVKQAALVGTVLFSVRAFSDGLLVVTGNTSHAAAAGIQALIAAACAAYFFFFS